MTTTVPPTATTAAAAATGPTATGPTLASSARAVRAPVLVLALLLLGLVGTALLSRSGPGGRLEPGSYAPEGAHAVAQLLRDRGVQVLRVDALDAALGGSSRTVLLVPTPSSLTPGELARLSARPGRLVVLAATQDDVDALGLAVDVGGPVPVRERRAACALPAAVTAGAVDLGGATYRARRGTAVGCYASGGRATLLRLESSRVTLVGSGDLLTNERLDDSGNAALALGLLAEADEVRWLVPAPGRRIDDGGQTPLRELLPDWVGVGALQLLLAATVLALWRARRLGRVVAEPLPVVVRAAEAVEGRARLYRAAGARDRAAEALRGAARSRLQRRLGLAATGGPAALVEAVAARTGEDPAVVGQVLHGPVPADDAALVRLADRLDALARSVTDDEAVTRAVPAPPPEGGSTP